jgi:hypothetical protein
MGFLYAMTITLLPNTQRNSRNTSNVVSLKQKSFYFLVKQTCLYVITLGNVRVWPMRVTAFVLFSLVVLHTVSA